MQLEEQLLTFAQNQVSIYEKMSKDNDISNDRSHSDGSYDSFKSLIAHWKAVAAYIADKYALDSEHKVIPAKVEDLSAGLSANISQAFEYLECYARLMDEANSAEETRRLEHQHQHIATWIAKHKRMANYYAYILGITHPFPGVDMLPAEIAPANAA